MADELDTVQRNTRQPGRGAGTDVLARRLKALADPVRLHLVGSLLAEPAQELCTCDLAPLVGLGEPTVSHHLKRLAEAGLVTKERRGVNVYYRAVPDAIDALSEQLRAGLTPDA